MKDSEIYYPKVEDEMSLETNPPLSGVWNAGGKEWAKQCYGCRYMKIFRYYDKLNATWWDGHCCAIPTLINVMPYPENMFRAIGNKNPNDDCQDFAEQEPEVKVGM
jgi:hypothetical protein